MKKRYEKPQVYMEKFELSHNVAVCDYKLSAANENECKILQDNFDKDAGDVTGGFASTPVCDFEYSIYCYSDGSGTLPSLFRS